MLNIKVLGNKVPGNKVPRNIVPMIKVTEEQGSGTSYGLCHIMTQYHLASLVPDICPTILSPITILIIRYWHSSWASPSGVILLGGGWSPRTSERIQEDGTSVSGFPLEYDLEYNLR